MAEERLRKDLFTNYSADARPVLDDHDTVTVTLGLALTGIIDMVSCFVCI